MEATDELEEIEEFNEENIDTPPTQKEKIIDDLEPRPAAATTASTSVTLELGDIIEIYAPTNPDIHLVTAIIQYIDEQKIKLINVATARLYLLNIADNGRFTDETITQIALLDRSDEKGYARQNQLNVRTWVDIHFGGEIPAIITGEITNLEEDMIEITTYPDLRTIFIDFAYRGIPEYLPIENIVIREKPASLKVDSLAKLKGFTEQETGEDDETEEDASSKASIQYMETGESVISIPEDSVPDENIRQTLADLYLDANTIVFGETLGEIAQIVEVPDEEVRYSIETQVNDFMEELLSVIPQSQRTKRMLDYIHILTDRFKELRSLFSLFDSNSNVYKEKTLGRLHKPLADSLLTMKNKLRWILPVVTNRKKIYYKNDDKIDTPASEDVLLQFLNSGFLNIEKLQTDYYRNKYNNQITHYINFENYLQQWFSPFESPMFSNNILFKTNVLHNMDAIVDNLEEFTSTTFHDNELVKRKYVIQRYNLGSVHLDKQIMKTGKLVYNTKNTTPNDEMVVKSMLMFPESVARFSAIDLPATNIMTRSNLHHNYLQLFRILKDKYIVNHSVDDLSNELAYQITDNRGQAANKSVELDDFLKKIYDFSIDRETNEETDENKYEKFLKTIVPSTRYFIDYISTRFRDKIAMVNIVQQLEPFMIYTDQLNYSNYSHIRYIIKHKITELRKKFQEKMVEFNVLKNTNYNVSAAINPVLRTLSENKEFIDKFFESYSFLYQEKANTKLSGQEILVKITEYDNGNLYTNMITSILISLMTPENFADALTAPPARIDDMTDNERKKATDCAQRYLTKRYSSLKELQEDNNVDVIYYDKEFDDTPYNFYLKKYEKEKKEMKEELFVEFMTENLIHLHNVPAENATAMAVDLISKKKRIQEGEYAILEVRPSLPTGSKETALTEKEKLEIKIESDIRKEVDYYRRVKNVWIRDTEISGETFIDSNALLCNIGEKCWKNTKTSTCESTDETVQKIKEATNQRMLAEFDRRYAVNIDELEKKLEKNIAYYLRMLNKLQVLDEIKMTRANNLAFEIGNYAKQTDDLLESPHTRLRDLILGQDDFSKKQYDICRFMDMFCRDPLVAEMGESPHWAYCKKTNTKLLPFSIWELANAFIAGNYTIRLAEICNDRGVLSDDGDSIVDKYSGYILRKLEFNADEGYDDNGFKITTHDILEQDLGNVIMEALGKKPRLEFENEMDETIYNIFAKICDHIDIPVDGLRDFVIRVSGELISKYVAEKDAYEKKRVKYEKEKNKKMKDYDVYKNELVILFIASVILVSIQTAIPSFQTKKTFPGCVRSFSGYPFDGGVEDMTGIKYIACVLNKTAGKSVQIWDSIKGTKVETLVANMKQIIESKIMSRSDMEELYKRKREYLANNPEKIALEEHSIEKWKSFMPPIVSFDAVRGLSNVSADFKSELLRTIRDGHRDQYKNIAVLNSKIMRYGYAVIQQINDVVKTKNAILKTMTNIPFLENACCNETEMTIPLVYFNHHTENQLRHYIATVTTLAKQYHYVNSLSQPPAMYHETFTGFVYPNVGAGQLEENIYAAVIRHCNLDNEKPVPIYLHAILTEKPPLYNRTASLREKIEFFKGIGKRFDIETLKHLLRTIFERNIVVIENNEPFSEVDKFKDMVTYLDNCNSVVFEKLLRDKIGRVLEDYNPKVAMNEDTAHLRDLKKYLERTNSNMFRIITKFFQDYSELTENKLDAMLNFLWNITKWNICKEDDSYCDTELMTVTQYLKNAVYSISKVYPNVLLGQEGFDTNIPNHWKLADIHYGDIARFISKQTEKLEGFKNDEILVQLLSHIQTCLLDIHTFVKSIPIYTEIAKKNEETGKTIYFYSLFDKETVFMLHNYCVFSCLYEYIISSDDTELLRMNKQIVRNSRRQQIAETNNPSNLVITGLPLVEMDDSGIQTENNDQELQEIQINTGNTEDLKRKVCSLLSVFLEIEMDNKRDTNFSYKEIKQRVTRSKDKERKNIVQKLGSMEMEERRVENMLKNLRMGRWNVGQQKGLVQYDKDTYERERTEMIRDTMGEIETDNTDIVTEMLRDVFDLEGEADKQADEEENLETIGFQGLGSGDGFLDGVFYDSDRDEDDQFDD
jgi:hypothetical protein